MSEFVLDASVTLAWFFENEFNSYAERAAMAVRDGAVPIVPPLWAIETTNAVLKAERRGRLSREKAEEIISLLRRFPVQFDDATAQTAFTEAYRLARTLDRSAYDAMYLELCLRRGLPLASSDVRQAARKTGIPIFLEE